MRLLVFKQAIYTKEPMQKALIIGADSGLGSALAKHLQDYAWQITGTSRQPTKLNNNTVLVDLENLDTIKNIDGNFDVIYMCAAITNTMYCEQNPQHSKQINCDAQLAIAEHCLELCSQLIFLSSNAVFDGSTPQVRVTASTNPRSIYGLHKARVEKSLLSMSNKTTIFRTSKVITPDYKLIKDWQRALHNNQIIEPFNDMLLCPVPINQAIELLAAIGVKQTAPIVHISGQEDITYSELAKKLAVRLGKEHLVQAKSSQSAGIDPAVVSKYSSLDMSETSKNYNLQPSSINDILDLVFDS